MQHGHRHGHREMGMRRVQQVVASQQQAWRRRCPPAAAQTRDSGSPRPRPLVQVRPPCQQTGPWYGMWSPHHCRGRGLGPGPVPCLALVVAAPRQPSTLPQPAASAAASCAAPSACASRTGPSLQPAPPPDAAGVAAASPPPKVPRRRDHHRGRRNARDRPAAAASSRPCGCGAQTTGCVRHAVRLAVKPMPGWGRPRAHLGTAEVTHCSGAGAGGAVGVVGMHRRPAQAPRPPWAPVQCRATARAPSHAAGRCPCAAPCGGTPPGGPARACGPAPP